MLHVAPVPPPLGGMASYVQGLLSSRVKDAVDVRVLRSDFLGKDRFTGFARVFINAANGLVLTCQFLFTALTWRPQIVHIQSNSGLGFYEKSWIALLAKLLNIRSLLHFHGGNLRTFYEKSPGFAKWLILRCAMINDLILTASPQMLDAWLSIGLPLGKLQLVGNAVEVPTLPAKRRAIATVNILFLTRIVVAKGILELIDAVRELRTENHKISLRVVGAEELETEAIRKYINGSGTQGYIEYVGPVSEAGKSDEYSRADVFAFPTHVEDQSYAVMEAMSYGLPCVASDVGGIPSLIKHGLNGLLVPPKDVPALKQALQMLAGDARLRRRLGQAARRTILEGFTWSRRAGEIVSIYRQLAHNG